MLIRKISKCISSKMIIRLNSRFLYPVVSEKNSTLLHPSPFQKFSRIQFLHILEPSSNNSKLFTPKSSVHPLNTLSIDGTPRVAKSDAQSALFEYLHCTRGLRFGDSEHISNNSPQFLQGLLAKVEKEQDVSRALTRFFRYHPINEFEPFFESLGLSPAEFAPLLPRGLIFLNDDEVLLYNYHALCDYGIPRSKIGRMCKEVNEIFRYEKGLLNMKFKAYEQLGLSRCTIIQLVSCSPLFLVGEVDIAFVGILDELKEMGFERNWIGGHISSKIDYNWNKILKSLRFLCEVGYNDAQMRALLSKDTTLLFDGSGKQVYVVVSALLKLGLNMNEVYALVLKIPEILSPKCAKNFRKAVHFLIEIGMEPESIAQILSTHMKLFSSNSLNGPKTVLKVFNGDKLRLRQTLKEDPSTFFNVAFKSKASNAEHAVVKNPNSFMEKTEFLLRIGYVENSDEMVKALKRFRGRGDQLQERFDCLVRAGLDFSAVSSMVKQAPTALNQTKYILEKKISCLKKLGYPVESIVSFPTYLCYDMERISLRFSMYGWLKENGDVKPMLSASTLLACSEARFVKYFVNIHPEGPTAWETFKRSLSST